MGQSLDVLIIGGGIIGLTSALEFAKVGRRVAVYDRGDLGREASWAGAGIIPPGNPAHAATPIDKLRAIGSERFPTFVAELGKATGIESGYLRCGGIEFLAASDAGAVEIWRREGIRHETCPANALSDLEPAVRPVPETVAYVHPDCAQVRNPWHIRALVAGCERLGVQLHPHTPVECWDKAGNRVAGVRLANGECRRADHYLIATGAWSENWLGPLGLTPGVHPVRGQIVLLKLPRPLFRRVLMVGKRYLVPRDDGRVLVGSTEEPEAGFVIGNTAEAVRGLLSFARDVVPELAAAVVERAWSGLRPGSPDGLPFIGTVPGHANVLVATGHFRAGVQLSIGTADMLVALVAGRPLPVSTDAFRPDRVPDLTTAAAFRS